MSKMVTRSWSTKEKIAVVLDILRGDPSISEAQESTGSVTRPCLPGATGPSRAGRLP